MPERDLILEQVVALEVLMAKHVEEKWALEGIRRAATEICRLAPDDLAGDYAWDIRIAAAGDQFPSGQSIAESIVGERIERLASYWKERPEITQRRLSQKSG